ncbi:MAG: hypothetical protein QXX49_07290 [Candidatus Caldarchaeum sp.]|uniref:SRPBCC family protein n=1 Tax=Caldiarchaeum subterraneum TaxID=311458 RepID=A0A7J3VTF7_CALS0
MRWTFRFTYELPASPGEVYGFFRNVENMGKAWPPDMKMRLVSAEGNLYTVGFRFLGQAFTARFRVDDQPGMKQHHETLEFPFGGLRHTIAVEPSGSGSRVVEEMTLNSSNPFAGFFFRKILEYREQAIKHSFGVAENPVYRDPLSISLAAGNFVSLLGAFAAYGLQLAPLPPLPGARFIAGLVSFMLLWFFTHDLAHYAVGRLAGVRFSNYYLGLSNIVRLGLVPRQFKTLPVALGIKIDRLNSTATPRGYAAMYAAGPIASMLFPLTIPLIMLANNPGGIAGQLLLLLAAANIVFTSIFSPKAGCIAKARKALAKPVSRPQTA